MIAWVRTLADEAATHGLGTELAQAVTGGGLVVHLSGALGTGKTTLTRGLLRALGYRGAVKSPTYTLIEPYEVAGRRVFHLDLYRLADPEELEYLGLRDLLEPGALVVIEWPEKGGDWLPPPDISIGLEYATPGREARLEALSARGEAVLNALQQGMAAADS